MKPVSPMPWDMVVILTIATVGFGFSVQRVMNRNSPIEAAESRQIASEAEATVSTAASGKVIDLGCLEQRLKGERISAQEGVIKFRGRLCTMSRQTMRKFQGLTVRNTSNGTEGTVIFQGYDNSFVTDGMSLKSGKNEIRLEWKASEKAEPRFVVTEVYGK